MPDFSLSDARRTLDLRRDLPAFERLSRSEAAELGTTKENYGYGSEASELEVYVRARRLHIIVAVLEVIDDPLQRTLHDSVLNDEEDLESELFSAFTGLLVAREFKGGVVSTKWKITHPDVGELANLGFVFAEVDGDVLGVSALNFKRGKVYVHLESSYIEGKEVSLLPLAEVIDGRLLR